MQWSGHMDEFRDVMMIKLEVRQMKEVLNMLHFTRGQVVHADDVEILFNETVTKVRA